MAATKNYKRTSVTARQIGAAFREATRSIDGTLLFERLSRLLELPEHEGDGARHTGDYVRAIMEVAAGEDADRSDARKFAQHFLSKKAHYSTSRAGIAAVLFEAWVAQSGGQLYAKFVETVLDNGDASFLAVFEGPLGAEDVRRMKAEVGGFVALEPIIEAGAVNYEDSEVFEFTLFDCKPASSVTKDDLERVQPKSAVTDPNVEVPGNARTTTKTARNESLLPSDRVGYAKVAEDGGLSLAAARFVLGEHVVDSASIRNGYLHVEDANGVPWRSESGSLWAPVVDALSEGERPPHYKKATGGKPCSRCRHFDSEAAHCELFEYAVKADMTCSRWTGIVGAKSDETADTDAEECDEETEEIVADAELMQLLREADDDWDDGRTVPHEELEEVDETSGVAPLYETATTGAMRSFFGSWALFETNVVDDDAVVRLAPVIVVGNDAWVMPFVKDDAVAVVDEVASVYLDLLAEGDKAIEAALREYAEEYGKPCDNADEVVALVESSDEDRPTVADRDYAIARRLVETGAKVARDADGMCDAIALALAPVFGDRLLRCTFDNRFGGGAVTISFSSAPATGNELAHLNAKLGGIISIGPFDPEGVAIAPKLAARLIRGARKQALGWRDVSGSLPKVQAAVIRQLREIAAKIHGLAEADEEGDDKKANKSKKDAPKPDAKPPGAKQQPPAKAGDAAPVPGEPEPPPDDDPGGEAEPEATDRMDEPEFYRDDLQVYYDMMLGSGKAEPEALAAVKKRFKLKSVFTTPTGEVRSPGVTDNPDPPKPAPLPPPPPDEEQPPPDDEQDAPPPKAKKDSGGDKGRSESIDELWLRYLAETDHPVPDFEQWVLDSQPTHTGSLSGWTYPSTAPVTVSEAVTRLQGRARWKALRERQAATDHAGRYAKFNRLVNMRPLDIREHLRSRVLRETLERTRRVKTESIRLGVDASRHILRLKATPLDEWTENDWQWCNRALRYIERTIRTAGALVDESGRPTRKLLALRAWGHDPARNTGMISEAEALELIEHGLTRVIDPHTTDGPVQIVERYEVGKGPRFPTLQKGRVTLSPEERERVMEKEAVWHHGPKGQETPAVWKSVVDGDTWYVTNTHRAYNVTPTLDGAIGRYHKFIKSTA